MIDIIFHPGQKHPFI